MVLRSISHPLYSVVNQVLSPYRAEAVITVAVRVVAIDQRAQVAGDKGIVHILEHVLDDD